MDERLIALLVVVWFAVVGVLLLVTDEDSIELRTGLGLVAIGLAGLAAVRARWRP